MKEFMETINTTINESDEDLRPDQVIFRISKATPYLDIELRWDRQLVDDKYIPGYHLMNSIPLREINNMGHPDRFLKDKLTECINNYSEHIKKDSR